MDKNNRRNPSKNLGDEFVFIHRLYNNKNNRLSLVLYKSQYPWSKDMAKHGNKSILVLYLPSYLLFSRRGSCTRYCRLVLSYCRDHRVVYEPWSSKRGNNVTFLPIPVVLPIVVVRTRITVSLRARANLRRVVLAVLMPERQRFVWRSRRLRRVPVWLVLVLLLG